MQWSAVTKPRPSPACLIIDDSHFDCEMMTRVVSLSYAKMRTQIANNLQSAREVLSTETISLILLDNDLPDGNGANFALELATSPKLNKIPVIIVSGWPTPFMWDKAEKAGVISVIDKSEFNVPYFKEAVRGGVMGQMQ